MADNSEREKNFERVSHQTNLNCKNVSQQINIDKQEFNYIINLNTTVCTKEPERKRKCSRKHRSKNSERHEESKHRNEEECTKEKKEETPKEKQTMKDKHKAENTLPNNSVLTRERPVPRCFRSACWNSHERRQERFRRNDEQTESRMLLSPISSSPLEDDSISYDDVSSASLHIEPSPDSKRHRKPTKQHMRQHKHKRGSHESKLDTLIRRAKERERILVEQSRRKRGYFVTSTPTHNEHSSVDFAMNCSDMELSFNSVSTILIAHNAYSPTCPIEDLETTTEELNNPYEKIKSLNKFQTETFSSCGYSPSSPTNDYTPKISKESGYKLINVKNETAMEIEAYSPTSKLNIDCSATGLKRELLFKSEPLSPCAKSPNYFDDAKLEYCAKGIKSEFVDK